MRVTRFVASQNKLVEMTTPFRLTGYGTEELIFVMDQSSTCTALTVGNLKTKIYELITFERDKKDGETASIFVHKLSHWLKELMTGCNVICYSIERFVHTNYVKSDKVTKEVRGVLVNTYYSAECIDSEGKEVLLSKNAEMEEINNKEWKAMIVPSDYFKEYKDDKIAVHKFIGSKVPIVRQMKQDIADAICMYLFLMQTKYGTQKLKASKSSINMNHNLVALAIPFNELSGMTPEIRALSESGQNGLNRKQLEYRDKFREGFVKRYIHLLQGVDYRDEHIEKHLTLIDSKIVKFWKTRTDDELSLLRQESKILLKSIQEHGVKEFEFNDALTVEENIRCFTCRNKMLYYSVIPKTLHYCYTIPMFDLLMGPNEEILIMATNYSG